MYDHLIGEVVETRGTVLVLRVQGVGYELKVPLRTAIALVAGSSACLHTILHMVEGAPTLLGFPSANDRALARRILGVTGVGPAIALALLSTHTAAEFRRLIVDADAAALQRIKGVGRKTAERLCLELRDRLDDLGLAEVPSSTPSAVLDESARDAVAALMTLGYTEKEARKNVERKLVERPGLATDELIKAVLRG